MTFNEFQTKMLSFMNPETLETKEGMLLNSTLGLSGESGEVADKIKKWCYHGHDLDITSIKKELGDCLFYVALGASAVDATLEEIAELNVTKLSARYPNGFCVEDSKLKKDETNEGN